MLPTINAAKFLMDNNLDKPRDTFKGNVKLQKLLYFAQLISLAKFHSRLFKSPIYAFKHGMVVDDVRRVYKHNLNIILKAPDYTISDRDKETLYLTIDLFGSFSAKELSSISHQLRDWKLNYTEGCKNAHYPYNYNKQASEVSLDDLYNYGVPYVDDLLRSRSISLSTKNPNKQFNKHLNISGINLYYNSSNISTLNVQNYISHRNIPKGDYVIYNDGKEVIMY